MDLRNELKIQGGGGMKLSVQEVNRRVEVEAVDEGVIGKILVAAGTEGVKVNAIIAVLASDGEEVSKPAPNPASASKVLALRRAAGNR